MSLLQSFLMITSALLTTPLTETTIRQRCSQPDCQKTCCTCSVITKQQAPADQHRHFMLQQTGSCNSTPFHKRPSARTVISTPRQRRQGYVHIFDHLQLRLRPDYTATPTICTKYRDHPNLLGKNLSYLPNPSARAGYDTRSIFKRSLTGLNSEFSFS